MKERLIISEENMFISYACSFYYLQKKQNTCSYLDKDKKCYYSGKSKQKYYFIIRTKKKKSIRMNIINQIRLEKQIILKRKI